MSDFRKLLLAFAAVTLLAGIASAGPAPALNHTVQPLSVRADATSAIAPNIISIEVNKSEFCSECGAGLQMAPAFLVETSGTFKLSAPQSLNIGAPALPPAPNIAALNTAQAAANLNSNHANTATYLLSQMTLGSNILNGITANSNKKNHALVFDVGQSAISDAANAFNAHTVAQPGQVVAPILAVPAVARTGPNNAGVNAG